MKKRLLWLVYSAIALVLGALMYGLFRQNTYIGKIVGMVIGSGRTVDGWFSGLCAWYLPDYLWVFSLSCVLFSIMLPKGKQIILWSGIAFSIGALWELLQMLEVVSGTADLCDIFLYGLAALTAAIVAKQKKER